MADTEFVIRIEGHANGSPSPFDEQFVAEYNPDGVTRVMVPGVGPATLACHLVCTPDAGRAMRMSFAEAHRLWKSESVRYPLRVDGLPNRPLTAFNVSIERAPERTDTTKGDTE